MNRTTLIFLLAATGTLLAACGRDAGEAAAPSTAGAPVQEAAGSVPPLARVDGARIANADDEPGNWLSHGRDYGEQRFSPLDAINDGNVARLGLAWSFDFPTRRGIESTPLVVDGVMYVTSSWSRVFALEAKTGKLKWEYDPKVPGAWAVNTCCDVVNRGVAVWQGKVFVGTIDGRLVALDAATGKEAWSVQTTPTDRSYSITGAPRVVKGKVIIGNGGADLGVRGFVSAYDAETGTLAWRFYTVPGDPSQPFESPALAKAAETWKGGEWWKVGGGGTVWDSMAFDPALDLLYVGVGNGSPWNRTLRSPGGGDNLYLASILALRPDTGEYVWHYQTTPGESWDYTATQHMILADLTIDGAPRKVIMQAPKNGFFYVIDRTNGEFISAEKYTQVTWATHIDKQTGRPVENPDARYAKAEGAVVWPHPLGGHNWHPMSFSPKTGLVYIPAQEIAALYRNPASFSFKPGAWNTGVDVPAIGMPDDKAARAPLLDMVKGHIAAWDPVAQKEVWRVQHPNMWNGGLLSTAGNLLFQGNAEGRFVAYRADTGATLWSTDAQTGVVAAPISYRVDGEQYIAVAAGWGGAFALVAGELAGRSEGAVNRSRVLVYKLDGKATLPVPVVETRAPPQPPAAVPDPARVKQGYALYMDSCHVCHGDRAVSGSSVPDLRYMSPETHAQFEAIVLGGLRHANGMAGFAGKLSPDEVSLLHDYLSKRAQDVVQGLD